MAEVKKAINGLEQCVKNKGFCGPACPYYAEPYGCRTIMEKDALELLKAQEESREEVSGTLDKLIKETQELLSKAPTDFDIVKGIIERSSLRKHFDESTIETGERIITLRYGADEVDLLFDKGGRIE